jgi:predicted esterase
MKTLAKYLRGIVTFVYIVVGLPVAALAVLLLVQAETAQGRMCGLAASLLFPVPVLLVCPLPIRRRSLNLVATGFLITALGLLAVCYAMTPNGKALPGSSADSVFTGKMSYQRMSLANLVPEIDQLKLGSYVAPVLDSRIDQARAIRIRRLFVGVYREMRQSEEFNHLGSVMNFVYRDLLLGRRSAGHLYQYIPAGKEHGGKLPVILFLHGSLGNFKGYLWVWKRFADENGYAIVAPSFGMGNWYLEGGIETIEEARQYCRNHPRLDGNRIYLAGLSNGGTGVTRAVAANGVAYAGFILISPVIEMDVISTPQFLNGCKGRRVLVLHGAADERIPAKYVAQSVDYLVSHDIAVNATFYPGEDHFLLFSQRDLVLNAIASWLAHDKSGR